MDKNVKTTKNNNDIEVSDLNNNVEEKKFDKKFWKRILWLVFIGSSISLVFGTILSVEGTYGSFVFTWWGDWDTFAYRESLSEILYSSESLMLVNIFLASIITVILLFAKKGERMTFGKSLVVFTLAGVIFMAGSVPTLVFGSIIFILSSYYLVISSISMMENRKLKEKLKAEEKEEKPEDSKDNAPSDKDKEVSIKDDTKTKTATKKPPVKKSTTKSTTAKPPVKKPPVKKPPVKKSVPAKPKEAKPKNFISKKLNKVSVHKFSVTKNKITLSLAAFSLIAFTFINILFFVGFSDSNKTVAYTGSEIDSYIDSNPSLESLDYEATSPASDFGTLGEGLEYDPTVTTAFEITELNSRTDAAKSAGNNYTEIFFNISVIDTSESVYDYSLLTWNGDETEIIDTTPPPTDLVMTLDVYEYNKLSELNDDYMWLGPAHTDEGEATDAVIKQDDDTGEDIVLNVVGDNTASVSFLGSDAVMSYTYTGNAREVDTAIYNWSGSVVLEELESSGKGNPHLNAYEFYINGTYTPSLDLSKDPDVSGIIGRKYNVWDPGVGGMFTSSSPPVEFIFLYNQLSEEAVFGIFFGLSFGIIGLIIGWTAYRKVNPGPSKEEKLAKKEEKERRYQEKLLEKEKAKEQKRAAKEAID